MGKRKIWLILAILAFAAAGVCVFFVWKYERDKEVAKQAYVQMRQEMRLETPADATEAAWEQTEDETEAAREQTETGKPDAGEEMASEGTETESTEPETVETKKVEPETVETKKAEPEKAETEKAEKAGTAETEIVTDLVIPVDFEELEEVNPDIYAWITIPGTAIDYPVVQNKEDNSFYLTRSAEREENVAGAIFSENLNKTDFSDVHTVLYGHNMKDGSMFADLHKYEDEAFFADHQEISIYTPDAIRCYRIFASYIYDDRHLLQSFDCEDPDIFEAYIKSVKEQRSLYAHIDENVKVEAGDRILTLSTCHSMGNEYRYLVQAVLEKTIKR